MVKINLGEIPDFENLPKGIYHFLVSEVNVDETSADSKHPGAVKWNVELTVQDGELEGRKEFLNIMFDPYVPYALPQLLRATVGQHKWSEEDLQDGDIDVEAEDLLDLEFVANVRPNKKNKDFNDVVKMRPYDPDEWDTDLLP